MSIAASTILGRVADAQGIETPSDWGSSTELNARQLRAALNKAGRRLARRYPWQSLHNEASWTSVAAELQGTITALFGAEVGYILGSTIWNRTEQERVGRPLTAEEIQTLRASTITSPYYDVRFEGDSLYLHPAPPAGQSFYLTYQSDYWVSGSGDSAPTKAAVEAAADLVYLDDYALELLTTAQYRSDRKLDYAQEFEDAEAAVNELMMRDGATKGMRNLRGSPTAKPVSAVIPQGNWNL